MPNPFTALTCKSKMPGFQVCSSAHSLSLFRTGSHSPTTIIFTRPLKADAFLSKGGWITVKTCRFSKGVLA
ncbi:UNVERIFIED_CONTAM: hypothetical protein FKN15_043513 [Acipenser sinensis]